MVRTLADKTLFQKYAEREGFPVPRAIVVCDPSDLPLLSSLKFPVVIKPGDKTLVLDGKVERVVRADTLESASAAAMRMLNRASRLVIQEWIDGRDTDIYFTLFTCDSHSHIAAMFSGRKLVCDPPAIGNTAVCAPAKDAAAELETMTRQFVARVEYQGIGSLEFKRDRANGRFVIVEPTVGRTDWQEEIATLCGVNIPLIAYWTELGQVSKEASNESAGTIWRSSVAHKVPAEVRVQGSHTYDGYFRLGDPLPGVYHYVIEAFAERLYRRARRTLGLSVHAKV
jgi:predicted ATP-grasp superfamily ATP-dependent carboligase